MSQRGDCCGCGIGDVCEESETILRVSALKRWGGWVPFDKDPAEDVVETLYRKVTVTETVDVDIDHAELIYARQATAEEIAAYSPSIGFYTCPYGSATTIYLYADGDGNPVNFTYLKPTVSRTTEARMLAGTFSAASRLTRQDGWGISGWGYSDSSRQPGWEPQYKKVEGALDAYCLGVPEFDATQTQSNACDCTDNYTAEHETDWNTFPQPGYNDGEGCPPTLEGFECAAGANGRNGTYWIFTEILTPNFVSQDVSEDGLTMTIVYQSNDDGFGNFDTRTYTVSLSEPWTLDEAEEVAQSILNRVDLTAGREYYQCDGTTITLGCDTGQEPHVSVTEDPVCIDGEEVQPFTVMPESQFFDNATGAGWDDALPEGLMSQRYWALAMSGSGQIGLVILTKGARYFGTSGEICRYPYTHPDNSLDVTIGGVDTCDSGLTGIQIETPLTPGLMSGATKIWGRRVVSA